MADLDVKLRGEIEKLDEAQENISRICSALMDTFGETPLIKSLYLSLCDISSSVMEIEDLSESICNMWLQIKKS